MLTKLLVKKFIPKNAPTNKIRAAYGTLSSVTNIICNVTLFIIKYIAGIISGSVSITSDAFNNLSDCASCTVALFGGLLASKPADKKHPFGHGRIEYLAAMIIAAFIMIMGFELLSDSVSKIFSPKPVKPSVAVFVILAISIAVKLWMAAFNTNLGKAINSSVILAAAKDSKSDIIATSTALIALPISYFTSLPIDGIAGAVVSVFILKSGFDIIHDTLDDILGKPGSSEIAASINELILSHKKILGVHDLIIHNYGPGKSFGSCHIEISRSESFYTAHDLTNHIEKRIMETTGISMTIHMDPVDTKSIGVQSCKEFLTELIADLDRRLTIHDLRLFEKNDATEVNFDLVVPFDCDYKNEQLQSIIAKELKCLDPCYKPVITFDRNMTS
ncbi:MAG: cation diffusion facilitator family transporter [Ruminococcus sp.]|nr:cation diffusion facilitator family transporter [Ruminococcus sp.]